MARFLKQGNGWRLGWDGEAPRYKAMVGGDNWAFELTEAEYQAFCRLVAQLAATMTQMAEELMEEERISCEAESEGIWVGVEGFPLAYDLRLIVSGDRQCEGNWSPDAVPAMVQALSSLQIF
ncbi:DUF1818 family protein [Spirulina subsalsa]|nr:DUF1818 family protein [Spirulina subsalsa]